jgi:hypothetical protein
MTDEARINSLIARFREIKGRADDLLERAAQPITAFYRQPNGQSKALAESYETARSMFVMVSKGESISAFLQYDKSVYDVAQLQKLSIECAAAIGFLETLRSPIPTSDKDRLDSLQEQISSLETFNEKLHKHVSKAIEEYVKGHYLAAALLAGKATVYVLEQLPGKTDEEKADELVRSHLLNDQMKPHFLRGARRARSYFTHDITAIPEPQDAISLVSDACDLSLKLKKIQES